LCLAARVLGFLGTGVTGIAGFLGSTGVTGIAGFLGSTGVAGIAGFLGSTGVAGIAGFLGSTGILGFITSHGGGHRHRESHHKCQNSNQSEHPFHSLLLTYAKNEAF
jgi:hypothetical protein